MGNYEQLKQSVSDVIKTNGNKEITGSILQNVLLTIISSVGANATFAGIATPTTNPGTPDGPVFYLASESGTYTNFNAIELQDELSVLMWNGTWSSQQVFSVDDVPTAGSDNLVRSGGVAEELALGAVYDVSAKNPTAGVNNDGKFESLSALLSDANLNTLIPTAVRKGGMNIKFVQSSDNKYVQYRYMSTSTANADIENANNWQGVDKEIVAVIGNRNVAESNGVVNLLGTCLQKTYGFNATNKYYKSDNTIGDSLQFGYFRLDVSSKMKKVICNTSTLDAANYCFDENGTLLYSKKYRPTVLSGGPYFYEFDIPSGTSYIVFNNYFYDGADYNNLIGNPNPVIIIDGILVDSFYVKKLSDDISALESRLGGCEEDIDELQYNVGDGLPAVTIVSPTPLSTKSDAYIKPNGSKGTSGGYKYKIYDLSNIKKFYVRFSDVQLRDVDLWATYSELVDGDIDDSKVVRQKYWTRMGGSANEAIVIGETEKYIAVSNRNAEYIDSELSEDEQYSYSSKIEELEGRVDVLEDEFIARFANKKIVVLGDSITHLGIETPAKGWTTYFLASLGFKTTNFKNYARSGATWSNTENTQYDITEYTGNLSDDNVIYNQVNRLLADLNNNVITAPDYIIILAGTNDALFPASRPGATSKTADEVFSNETIWYLNSKPINECTSIAEAIRYVSEMISTNIPTAQVIVTTPLQSTAITYARNELVSGIIEGCAKYLSWNVVNQSKECSISRIEEKHANYKTYDGTHPSEIGAACIGHTLAAIMSAILRY